jgi:hypothetical protein
VVAVQRIYYNYFLGIEKITGRNGSAVSRGTEENKAKDPDTPAPSGAITVLERLRVS